MIAEDVEFQISQYADGSLSLLERAAVETLLQSDADARGMLVEYRKLDSQLAQLRLPQIKWDKLAAHISDAIISGSTGEAEKPAIAGRIGWGGLHGRLRIAAAVLITATAGLVTYRTMHHPSVGIQPVDSIPSISDVSGPVADGTVGQPTVDVTVGPSALAQSEAASHDVGSIVPGRSRVIINEAIADPAKNKLHPH